jgi:uncharacterized DUF497 family protein
LLPGGYRFEWDPHKAAVNRRKHGISFEEASTAFDDDRALIISDPDHSDTDERFVLVGMSSGLRILVVVHGEGSDAAAIRIISARKATPTERTEYARRRWRL